MRNILNEVVSFWILYLVFISINDFIIDKSTDHMNTFTFLQSSSTGNLSFLQMQIV